MSLRLTFTDLTLPFSQNGRHSPALRSAVGPFDRADWIFELKYDASAPWPTSRNGRCQLVSQNGTPFGLVFQLDADIGTSLQTNAVVDGEIVCLDSAGHPQFHDYCFIAVPLLFCVRPALARRQRAPAKHADRAQSGAAPDGLHGTYEFAHPLCGSCGAARRVIVTPSRSRAGISAPQRFRGEE